MKHSIKFLAALGALAGVVGISKPSHAVEGMFRIAPKIAPHKSFDLPGGGCPYNAPNAVNTLALYTHDNTCGNGDQRWYIHDVGGGQHEIRQGGPGGRCLDIEGGGNGYTLGTWDCNGGSGQRFWFTETYNSNNDGSSRGGSLYGEWKIQTVHDSRVIDLANANTANGTQIRMWTSNESDAQRWILWGNGGMHEDFSDDFNGNGIDQNVWNIGNMPAGKFNNEYQRYEPGQCQEWGGHLTMVANNTGNCTGFNCFASCRINSKNKRYYQNGQFSSRIHYYESNGGNMGTWPAFWMTGNNIAEDPVTGNGAPGACWPTWTARELDIWEWAHNRGSVYTANAIASGACQAYNSVGSREDAWWDTGGWVIATVRMAGDGRVRFYNGGRQVLDVPDGDFYNQPYAMIFNLAVGGTLGGNTGDFNNTGKWASVDADWVAHETW